MAKIEKKNYWAVGLVLLGIFFGLMSAWSFYRAGREVSSVVDPHYYARGLKYNESMRSRKAAEDLGWHAVVEVANRRIVVRLSAADRSPVTGCRGKVSLQQVRNTTSAPIFELLEEAPGVYSAELPADLAGAVAAELSLSKENLLIERHVLLNIRQV